ncbi:hypothetical protein PF005_g7017 [Phytophthora fragariae]|uniref:DDE Tnp4 domain-containing protein n=2 Tax=Phytophthora fragariae TaxID=53985 RepID=A0A6A3IRJ9_9STRA|nr:hypothetical protein PF003_g39336 [Phytophthora fragariae]KAE8925842.1 hypothetical protein PF009_g23952 [Phytophthora fragariae]KAE8982774.1 hypothetical protein PF011_g21476 [Phytophthora fragariae]KAE9089787.1 hypothetical protein PF007_g19480 [Phytophthora fragariae]KAE9100966.1 hypothetical protein PF006_g22783 [Phytophthora fragariae]
MPSTPTQVIDRLTCQWDDEAANLVTSHENFGEVARHVEEEASDAESPILAEYTAAGGGDETLKAMTNFSAPELDALWALVEPAVTIAWTQGRGRKPSISGGKDALFVTLTVLKHFDTWQKHAIDFNIGMSTLEKMVHRGIRTIEPVLYPQLVARVTMAKQMGSGNAFSNYPHALYATDVKFQPAYRPSGRFTEKVYFSAKHKLYGFKVECSVAPPGLAVDVSDHSPGSCSDVTMMLDRMTVHRQMLRKEDTSGPEMGGEPTQFPDMWAVLVDKGYQGAGRVLRTIQPKKKPRGGTLDRDDLAWNRAVSSDRVLVENSFGRMCMIWKATNATFKWNENRFDSVGRLCTALTNFHVGLMPLRARDSDHYDMVLAKYQSMGDRVRTQRARAQRHYRMRQQLRSPSAPYTTRPSASQRET